VCVMDRRLLIAELLIACTVVVSCVPAMNYDDPLEPRFAGNFSDERPDFDGTIKVVSYNIGFAKNVDRAIYELAEFAELRYADIILLQEMDEVGTQSIAQALGYEFVYYPASVHSYHDKNFGNAILSKWPITESEKVLLPYVNPRNKQRRIAVKAVINIDQYKVLTYSVHIETVWLGRRKRDAQMALLVSSIDGNYRHAVVGGDFNTVTPKSVRQLEERFERIGMERASKGSGCTVRYPLLGFTLDHIFTKGMSVSKSGTCGMSEASDHVPIWVEVVP
jgi:endonuclease/exonuclease/phosphatase family metal-dependent hydrolase